MTTTSYPAVGTNGLSESQWSVMFGDSDGIVEDYHVGGIAAFTLTNAGDQLTIGTGKVRLNGYVLSVDAPETFTVSPSTSATVGWYVCAIYDPSLNVAQADGTANPLGPCRLTVTAGAPSLTNGKVALTLYRFDRAVGATLATALAALTGVNGGDFRSWVGPTVFIGDYSQSWTGFGPWPRGSRLIQTNRNGTGWYEESFRVPSGTSLTWASRDYPTPIAFPFLSTFQSQDPAPATPQYLRLAGNMIKMRGSLKRANGNNLSNGNPVLLGTMPPGCRPLFTERFVAKAQGASRFVELYVQTDGTVTMADPSGFDTNWVDLSVIHYRAEV